MQLIITSFEKQAHAKKFALGLLAQKLAACCSIFPGATSLYTWKEKKVTASEVFLLIKTAKTSARKMKEIETYFAQNHPYELPEFITLKADASAKFGRWIASQLKK